MSLNATIRIAAGTLSAMQFGLQVVGNNIANAGTPGYIREDIVFKPGPPLKKGNLIFGLGVQVDGIVLKIDRFLAERLRDADSDLRSSETQQDIYRQLETLLAGLGDNDLGSSLTSFFGTLHDVVNQPEDAAVRNISILQGEKLAGDIRRLDQQLKGLYQDVDQEIINLSDSVNRLLERIAELNVQIVGIEGGGLVDSDAVSLRDERQLAMSELASIIDIRTVEQDTGSVSVFANGEYLVFDSVFREVESHSEPGSLGLGRSELRIVASDSPISSGAGRLAGLTISRDEIVGEFINQLDSFAQSLVYELNKVHSSGQGLSGYQSLTSEFRVSNITNPLDQDELPFTPVNGSFQVQVYNSQSNTIETTDVFLSLNGLDDDTSLADLRAALDNIDGLSASTTPDGKLTITSDSPTVEFTFANDTSGVLAALGLNTFFTGSTASDIGINQTLLDDPTKLATSSSGIGQDTVVAQQLADLLDTALESHDDATLAQLHDRLLIGVTQGSALVHSVTEGFRSFYEMLESQHLEESGVNIDEEAVKMITLQRTFQASAKLITTLNELLEVLVNL